ncbi:hypothetical protein PC117_g9652 [Phytophthora cactorum]|uniref:Uncharacterized protein n=1 Tax=Phytophthora cactorum TaxID=29920 RepID=A0A8T1DNC8_9STRA|nr:hypothetical protein PC117_g9652 [Phytophthora cactorum]
MVFHPVLLQDCPPLATLFLFAALGAAVLCKGRGWGTAAESTTCNSGVYGCALNRHCGDKHAVMTAAAADYRFTIVTWRRFRRSRLCSASRSVLARAGRRRSWEVLDARVQRSLSGDATAPV